MRLGWAIAGGVLLGSGLAWWFSRDTPAQAERKQAQARETDAADSRPGLYRWRDAHGTLQVTSKPPEGANAGRPYKRIDVEPRAGIEVHGDRE